MQRKLLLILFLVGCSGSAPPPSAKNESPPPIPGQGGELKPDVPALVFARPEDYTYNPVGKRDPFKKFAGEIATKDMDLPTSPLERFDLDQLNVTAIIWGISEPRALLKAPDGYSYIVKKSMRVGKNRGRVSRITRREMFVEEEFRDPTGKLVVRETTLEIRPKDQEEQKKVMEFRYSDE